MEQKYTPESVRRLRDRARRAVAAAAGAGAAALCGCIALCAGVRTANAGTRLTLTIALSALGLFTAVTLLEDVRKPALREAAHEEGVLREAAVTAEGRIAAVGDPHPIPKSITFLPVTLETADGAVSLKLNARLAGDFPAEGRRVRAETRRGYLTAWEDVEDA